jgi:steroid delta-isomerase
MRPFTDPRLERTALYFETLSHAAVSRLSDLYHPQAYFKDPFNEVQGLAAIERIFAHMYTQVQRPQFQIVSGLVQADTAWLEWDFSFEQTTHNLTVRGASKIIFDAEGKIISHRDFWDTGEELYAKLPVIGWVVRQLRKKLSAKQ